MSVLSVVRLKNVQVVGTEVISCESWIVSRNLNTVIMLQQDEMGYNTR